MAETPAGRQLTEQHRRSQLSIRSRVVSDLLNIWPMFDVDDIDRSWPNLQASLSSLILTRRRESAEQAASYYRDIRAAEGPGGDADPRLAETPDRTRLIGTLSLVGPVMAKRAAAARRPNVADDTLTRLAGSSSRFALEGGRETLIRSIRADREVTGWRRVTDSSPCSFCADIAGEGIVPVARGSDFSAHDHCGCTAEPAFR